MLCLLMDAGWLADEADEHLGALSNKVSGFLEEVQQTMERASSPYVLSLPPFHPKNLLLYILSKARGFWHPKY